MIPIVVVIALSVLIVPTYIRTPGPTMVTIDSTQFGYSWQNLPPGYPGPHAFQTDFGWANSTGNVLVVKPGAVEGLNFAFSYMWTVNCAIDGVNTTGPFTILSLAGFMNGAPRGPHPFPFDFSPGPVAVSASLYLNVSMPTTPGTYSPYFQFEVGCTFYSQY